MFSIAYFSYFFVIVLEELDGNALIVCPGLLVTSEVGDMTGVDEILASELSEGFDDGILVTEIVSDEDCVLVMLGDTV